MPGNPCHRRDIAGSTSSRVMKTRTIQSFCRQSGANRASNSAVALQSIPGECLRFTDQLAHNCAQFHAFLRVAAVTKISIAFTLGCSGALAASMFSASGAAVNGRRATWLAGSRSSPAAPSLAQSHRLGAWVHRVVHHFQVSPSAGALFTIPTRPWAPG